VLYYAKYPFLAGYVKYYRTPMAKRVIKDYPDISLNPEDITGMLDFEKFFGRTAPVEIEVGSGKGTFLLNQAREYPEINYFGIEWANKYYKHAVDRIGRWGLENVRLIRTDAAFLISEHIPDESIQRFHLYFPDPWPKARHNKRRFFNHENIIQILRILKPGGVINIATDHAEYFVQMEEVIGSQVQAGTVEIVEYTRAAGAAEGEVAGTNYERKYIKEKRNICTIAAKKC
jgi:tRNA (guanine-N7-)-methyltransferase